MHARPKKDHTKTERNAITEETEDLMELEIATFARMMIAKADKTEMIGLHEEVAVDEGVVAVVEVVEEASENSNENLEMTELASSLLINETAADLITGVPTKMTLRQNKTRPIPPLMRMDNLQTLLPMMLPNPTIKRPMESLKKK